MSKRHKPIWTEEQQAAGKRMKETWEEFFSTAEGEKETSDSPLLRGTEDSRVSGIRARHEADLMRYPNVVGVADGVGMRAGKPTGEDCIVVYVERKVPKSKLEKGEVLPRRIEGVLVDVVEVGRVEPLRD